MINKNLFEKLEKAERAYTVLFGSGIKAKLRRFCQYPVRILIRKFQEKFVKRQVSTILIHAKTFFGYRMRIHSFEYGLSFGGFLMGQELKLEKFIIKNLYAKSIFLDIGAHHGFYTLLAHKIVGTIGGVHSFEPTKLHYSLLKWNTKSKSNVFINNLALCNNDGEKIFYENIKGKSTFEKDFFQNVPSSKPSDFKKIIVTCTTLDEYCNAHNIKPTFLKIDVEGAEFEVLMGGQQVLKQYGPIVAMEIWGEPYDNTNHFKAIRFLQNLGYKPYRLKKDGDTISLEGLIQNKDSLQEFAPDNFIFRK